MTVEYHYRNAVALTTSLNDKSRHGKTTNLLLCCQTAHLQNIANGLLGPHCQTPKYLNQMLKYNLRPRQCISIHASGLKLTYQGQLPFTDTFQPIANILWTPKTRELPRLINFIVHPLMEGGISNFFSLLSHEHTHVLNAEALNSYHHTIKKKQTIALNRLASLANCNNLSQSTIDHAFTNTDADPNKAPELRQIYCNSLDLPSIHP